MKLQRGVSDPFRITGGTTDSATDLDPELIFTANYRAIRADKYSIPYAAGAGSEGEISMPDYGHPPLTFALAIQDDGTPVFPYFYEFKFFTTVWNYNREYILWQVTPTKLRYWVFGQPSNGTLHVWNIGQ